MKPNKNLYRGLAKNFPLLYKAGLYGTGTCLVSSLLRTDSRTFSGPVPFWPFPWTYPYDFTASSNSSLERKTRHSSAEGRRERSSAAAESRRPSTREACESKRDDFAVRSILDTVVPSTY